MIVYRLRVFDNQLSTTPMCEELWVDLEQADFAFESWMRRHHPSLTVPQFTQPQGCSHWFAKACYPNHLAPRIEAYIIPTQVKGT